MTAKEDAMTSDRTKQSYWELAQAVALNSDMATYFAYKPFETDEEEAENQRIAKEYFDIRNNCVREIRDREQAALAESEVSGG